MKLTKEEAKKLLETAEAILKEYETWTDPETGVTTDDEGNVVSRGWRGGRHSTNGYNRRYYNAPRPTPVTPTVPRNPEDTKWMKYLPSFRNKEWNRGKTDEQLKPLILAWLAKQQAKAAPPVAESMLENEVKSELLEVASKLLQEAQKKMKEAEKKGKKFTQKGHDIAMNVKKSEKEAGKSDEEAERIAWATATKQGERIKGK